MNLFDDKIISVKMKNGKSYYGTVISSRHDFEYCSQSDNVPIPEDWETNDEVANQYLKDVVKEPEDFYRLEIFTGEKENAYIKSNDTIEIKVIPQDDIDALMFKLEHDL